MLINNRLVITIPAERKSHFDDFDLPPELCPSQIKARLTTITKTARKEPEKSLDEKRIQIAEDFDNIWKNGELLSKTNEPNSFFYNDFSNELIKTFNRDKNLFLIPTNKSLPNSSFEEEIRVISSRKDISALTKSIILTQSLELALLGSNPTKVLKNINTHPDPKGFINELLAAWFLAKFIYKLSPVESNDFTQSVSLQSFERELKGGGKARTFTSIKEREIDILTDDAIVSVKCSKNDFSDQIKNLFFIVNDDLNPGLKDRVKKLVLIRSDDGKRRQIKQTSPEYSETAEYKKHIEEICSIARENINIYPYPEGKRGYDKAVKRLITPDNVEVHYLPSFYGTKTQTFEDELRDWIEKIYNQMKTTATL